MKGLGSIVILLALLGVMYLVAKDLNVLSGVQEGQTVIEPLERAKETAGLVEKTRDALKQGLGKIE